MGSRGAFASTKAPRRVQKAVAEIPKVHCPTVAHSNAERIDSAVLPKESGYGRSLFGSRLDIQEARNSGVSVWLAARRRLTPHKSVTVEIS